jgi:hypothetical protein
MAKKTGKTKGRKQARATGRAGSRAGARRPAAARRQAGRKTAGARTPKAKPARKRTAKPARARKAARATKGARTTVSRKPAPKKKTIKRAPAASARPAPARRGGSGHESTLAQTPATGRSVKGPTNPMPTRRSTGTPAGAGSTRRAPGLDRQRRELREVEENVPTPPSSLDMDRSPSAARSGRAEMRETRLEHNETSPVLTGGDVDADWQDAYAVGDEAPGGDNPTPDQDRVDDIGKALGVVYEDNEELKAADKITERDRHRWELDPASSEDYRDRDKDIDEE